MSTHIRLVRLIVAYVSLEIPGACTCFANLFIFCVIAKFGGIFTDHINIFYRDDFI